MVAKSKQPGPRSRPNSSSGSKRSTKDSSQWLALQPQALLHTSSLFSTHTFDSDPFFQLQLQALCQSQVQGRDVSKVKSKVETLFKQEWPEFKTPLPYAKLKKAYPDLPQFLPPALKNELELEAECYTVKRTFWFAKPTRLYWLDNYSSDNDSLELAVELPSPVPATMLLTNGKEENNGRIFQRLAIYQYFLHRALSASAQSVHGHSALAASSTTLFQCALTDYYDIVEMHLDGKRIRLYVTLPLDTHLLRIDRIVPNNPCSDPVGTFSRRQQQAESECRRYVLHDLLHLVPTHDRIQKALATHSAAQSAWTLGRLWLQKHKQLLSPALDLRLWSAILYDILQSEQSSTPIALFKKVLTTLLCYCDLQSSYVIQPSQNTGQTACEKEQPDMAGLADDAYRPSNLLMQLHAIMDACSFGRLQNEVRLSLCHLATSTLSLSKFRNTRLFEKLFLEEKQAMEASFDVGFRFAIEKTLILDRWAGQREFVSHLNQALTFGLSDRIVELFIQRPSPSMTGDDADVGTAVWTCYLKLNPAAAMRRLDKGPAVTASPVPTPDVLTWREFWGSEISELRRFKDSSLHECVYWASEHRFEILPKIVSVILERHLHQPVACEWIGLSVYEWLDEDGNDRDMAVRDLDDLSTILKGIQSPLEIKSLVQLSSSFRPTSLVSYTASLPSPGVLTRQQHAMPFPAGPCHVHALLLTLATNTAWPESKEAFYASLCAYFLHLSKCLTRFSLSSSHAEDEIWTNLACASPWPFLDIWYRGALYRLLVDTDALKRHSALLWVDKAPLFSHLYQQPGPDYGFAKEHHAYVRNICYRFPAYAPSVQLLTLWLSAQWRMQPIEWIEMIAAVPFLQSSQPPPSTAYSGWIAALKLLKELKGLGSDKDWIILPHSSAPENDAAEEQVEYTIKEQDQSEYGDSLTRTFRSFESYASYLAEFFGSTLDSLSLSTPYDPYGKSWRLLSPSPLLLDELSTLAAYTLLKLKLYGWQTVEQGPSAGLLSIFKPDRQEFDAIYEVQVERVLSLFMARVSEAGESCFYLAGFDPLLELTAWIQSSFREPSTLSIEVYRPMASASTRVLPFAIKIKGVSPAEKQLLLKSIEKELQALHQHDRV